MLCSILPDKELRRFLEHQEVRVRGLLFRRAFPYRLAYNGRVGGWCVEMIGQYGDCLPPEDELAGMYLAIKYNRRHFLARGNRR